MIQITIYEFKITKFIDLEPPSQGRLREYWTHQVSVDNELHTFFGFSVKDSVKFDALIDFIIVYLRYLVSPCWLEYLKQSFIDLVLVAWFLGL